MGVGDPGAPQIVASKFSITPRRDDSANFVEFPLDTELAGFDRSDRKFVAVALVSGSAPDGFMNAVDSDWAELFRRAYAERH